MDDEADAVLPLDIAIARFVIVRKSLASSEASLGVSIYALLGRPPNAEQLVCNPDPLRPKLPASSPVEISDMFASDWASGRRRAVGLALAAAVVKKLILETHTTLENLIHRPLGRTV